MARCRNDQREFGYRPHRRAKNNSPFCVTCFEKYDPEMVEKARIEQEVAEEADRMARELADKQREAMWRRYGKD